MKSVLGTRLFLVSLLGAASVSRADDQHRYTGDSVSFDFAIESSDDTALLFLTRKPTNEPMSGVEPKLVPDDEKAAPIAFAPTERPGIFKATVKGAKLPEGQISLVIDSKEEAADAYLAEDTGGHDHHGGHDHSHGGARPALKLSDLGKSTPVMGGAFAGVFLIGLLIGRAAKRRQVSIDGLIFAVLTSVTLTASESRADEGHTHATLEISDGAKNGEMSMTKKSQLLIELRTEEAKQQDVRENFSTFGHVVPKPALEAHVKAPIAGYLRLASDSLWGKRVQKGQILARIEGVGQINVTALISGAVLDMKALDGARVEAGEELMRIVDTSTVWIDAEVFQRDLAKVRNATTAVVVSEGSAPVSGRVVGAQTIIDEKSLTAKIFVEVQNLDGALTLGAMVDVELDVTTGTASQVYLLPKDAVLNRGGERIVFVQTGPESFRPKPVSVRPDGPHGKTIVTGGLEPGDRVVITGNYQLLVGAK